MTDEALIARLRDLGDHASFEPHMHHTAADRIEALTKERDDYAHKLMQANNTYTEMHLEIERLSDKLATCEKYRDAYAECDRIGTQAVRDLEAKLAENEVRLGKAVEALEGLIQQTYDCEKELTEDLHHMDFCGESDPLTKARATLAEIKKPITEWPEETGSIMVGNLKSHSDEFAKQKGESHE